MKKIFIILLYLTPIASLKATTYYVKASGGTGSGLDDTNAWSLAKLNSSSLNPGDSVLFKKGDVLYGSLTLTNSGTIASPIIYSSYGSGSNPIISGFTTVSSWTNLGGNIWESTNAISTLSTCNMVVINGINTAMGRFPNSGYFAFQSHSGTTSITSSSLNGVINWSGAEVVVRSSEWTLDRSIISSQSGSTLSFSAISSTPIDGYGFFIQNDVRTLDSQNEWYYNPSTNKIRIYSTSAPQNVQVATIDNLITIHANNIVFSNIQLQGANSYAFYGNWAGIKNNSIINCIVNYTGIDAINFAGMNNVTIKNNSFQNSNNNAINLGYEDTSNIIRNNYIYKTGVLAGMGQSSTETYTSIQSLFNSNSVIDSNTIINTGYNGIFAIGDSFLIRNNYVDSFCTVLQDGGGVYTQSQSKTYYNRKITGNITSDGIGAPAGTNTTDPAVSGIYLDDNSANVEVYNNSTYNCTNAGIFIHNGYNSNIHNNLSYNNSYQIRLQSDSGKPSFTGNIIKNNKFIAKQTNQLCGYFVSTNTPNLWGAVDSNYYARPIDDNLTMSISTNNWASFTNYNLSGWKTYSSQDANSQKSFKTITDTSQLRFEYNAASTSKTISLDQKYVDVTGASYTSIILAPYSSVVLIKNGAFTSNKIFKSGTKILSHGGKIFRIVQ